MYNVTLALAKAYTDKKQLAHSDWEYDELRWNSDLGVQERRVDNLDCIPGELLGENENCGFYRVTDTTIPLDSVTMIKWMFTNGGAGWNVVKKDMQIQGDEGLDMLYAPTGEDNGTVEDKLLCITLYQDVDPSIRAGTYFRAEDVVDDFATKYVHLIQGKIGEIIYPVPAKYIPPMDRIILRSPNGTRFAVTINNSGQLVVTVTEAPLAGVTQ